MTVTLILGGARSGKSNRALSLGEKCQGHHIFIATAEALDEEMDARIKRHREERQDNWETIEAPLDLVTAITVHCKEGHVVLVDCLTLWLSNIVHHGRDVAAETQSLITAIKNAEGMLILVSNEVGLGLVPETPLGREFRDAQGRLNQSTTKVCDVVEFIAAGLPIKLKS